MGRAKTTVGLVQVGEVIWERRPSREYQVAGGRLQLKPVGGGTGRASLAYLPHAVALLQAYVLGRAPGDYDFLEPIYKRLPCDRAVEHLLSADVVGFSVYVWNIRLSLAIAAELKRRRPQIVIVFGGPQVPERAKHFLEEHPFIDLVCHGEGERTFMDILERIPGGNWENVASVSYLDSAGRFVANPRRDRITDLDEIPSPMLEGVYAELIKAHPEQEWLLTWETNRGCPFSCAFCDWGSATGSKVYRYSMQRLSAEIEWMVERDIHYLFVCDANFGMLSRDVEIAEQITEAYRRRGSFVAISVQNTKNRTERSEEIQQKFQRSGVVSFGASISLQTVNPDVLKAVQRDNISQQAFERLHRHYAREGLDTYTDLIIGLPAESYDSFADGVASVIRGGQYNRVAFYECTILPNAPMADPAYRAEHRLETVSVRLVHAHEPLDPSRSAGIAESIDLVVSNRAMGKEDWVRARVYADFVEFAFFDRLLHLPILLLGASAALDYRQMFEALLAADAQEFPTLAGVRQTFYDHAHAMLAGNPQYLAAPQWLGIWWPPDQYALIDLMSAGKLDAFYTESAAILIRSARGEADPELIGEAVRLNRAMLAEPFQWTDKRLDLTYPVLEAYGSILRGETPDMAPRSNAVVVVCTDTVWMTWDDWYEWLVHRTFQRKSHLYRARGFAEPVKQVLLEPAGKGPRL